MNERVKLISLFVISYFVLSGCSSIKFNNYGTKDLNINNEYEIYDSDIVNGYIFSTRLKIIEDDLQNDIYLYFLNRNFASRKYITYISLIENHNRITDLKIKINLKNINDEIITPELVEMPKNNDEGLFVRQIYTKDQLSDVIFENVEIEYISNNKKFKWNKNIKLEFVDYVSVWDALMSI